MLLVGKISDIEIVEARDFDGNDILPRAGDGTKHLFRGVFQRVALSAEDFLRDIGVALFTGRGLFQIPGGRFSCLIVTKFGLRLQRTITYLPFETRSTYVNLTSEGSSFSFLFRLRIPITSNSHPGRV